MTDAPALTGLVDAHCHLQEEVLAGLVDDVIRRGLEAGDACFICNGTHEGDWETVLEISRRWPQVMPCLGLHPWFVRERSRGWLECLESFLNEGCRGLGEIGLDRWVRDRDEIQQEEAFRAQLDLANRLGLPVMIHCLRAWGMLLAVLEEMGPPRAGMVIHAWGGAAEMVRPLVEMGAYCSFAGSVLDPAHKRARAGLAAVPLDRLLVETDAPAMLPPRPFRPAVTIGPEGEVLNEPANLPAIVFGIAELRNIPAVDLARATTRNARRLMGDLPCLTTAS